MQDRYAGDVGDFGKLGMLRVMARHNLNIGVNWYYTYKPEEHTNADGKHIGYLDNNLFKGCDDELLKALSTIVNGRRSIAALERANIIPNAVYYAEILKSGNDKTFKRAVWRRNSLETFSESQLIFCDPDNGLIVKSVSRNSSKSDKYIMPEEVVSYYQTGKSVVFYNHRCREQEKVYLQRFEGLKQHNELIDAQWRGLKFVRGTLRDYIFILHPEHVTAVDAAIEDMMNSNWRRHFCIFNI